MAKIFPSIFPHDLDSPEMLIWANEYQNLENSILKMLDLNRSKHLIEEQTIQLIKKILYENAFENPFKNILKYGEHAQDLEFDDAHQSFLLSIFNNEKMRLPVTLSMMIKRF